MFPCSARRRSCPNINRPPVGVAVSPLLMPPPFITSDLDHQLGEPADCRTCFLGPRQGGLAWPSPLKQGDDSDLIPSLLPIRACLHVLLESNMLIGVRDLQATTAVSLARGRLLTHQTLLRWSLDVTPGCRPMYSRVAPRDRLRHISK